MTAPAQRIAAPAQLVTAPAQPPAAGVVVYTALFLSMSPFLFAGLREDSEGGRSLFHLVKSFMPAGCLKIKKCWEPVSHCHHSVTTRKNRDF